MWEKKQLILQESEWGSEDIDGNDSDRTGGKEGHFYLEDGWTGEIQCDY